MVGDKRIPKKYLDDVRAYAAFKEEYGDDVRNTEMNTHLEKKLQQEGKSFGLRLYEINTLIINNAIFLYKNSVDRPNLSMKIRPRRRNWIDRRIQKVKNLWELKKDPKIETKPNRDAYDLYCSVREGILTNPPLEFEGDRFKELVSRELVSRELECFQEFTKSPALTKQITEKEGLKLAAFGNEVSGQQEKVEGSGLNVVNNELV